jgi:hypothetical protein
MRLDQTITRCFPTLAKFIEREIPPYRFIVIPYNFHNT